MDTQRHIGIRQILGPAAAVALIAGGIIARPSEQSPTSTNFMERASNAIACLICPPEDGASIVVNDDFLQPLALMTQESGDELAFSTIQLLAQDDQDGVYSLSVENGKVTAKVNGKEISKDQIKHEDGTYTLFDENGKQIATFNVGRHDDAWFGSVGKPRTMFLREAPQGQVFAGGVQQAQPKVMVGITMSDAPTEILEGIVIDRVIEGLPAGKAGLQVGDIIIEIKGLDKASQEALRATLREKSPGDKLQVKVLRDGAIKEHVIALDAYDGSKLGVNVTQDLTMNLSDGDSDFFVPQIELRQMPTWSTFQHDETVQKSIEEAMKSLEGFDVSVNSEEIRKALEEAMKNQGQWSTFNERDADVTWRFFSDEKGNQFTVPKGAPHAQGWVTDDRTQELENRLQRLEEKIARLEKAIERLTADR